MTESSQIKILVVSNILAVIVYIIVMVKAIIGVLK